MQPQAEQVFRATNNTIGFNHAVYASDPTPDGMVFETMAGYTAYFKANDVR